MSEFGWVLLLMLVGFFAIIKTLCKSQSAKSVAKNAAANWISRLFK